MNGGKETPLTTKAEAYQRLCDVAKGLLMVGLTMEDILHVFLGVALSVALDTGPPKKVCDYLRELADKIEQNPEYVGPVGTC